ncbi:MAG: hypothetical protein ABSG44_09240 [Thermodesulfobacteriota bacterium]
MSWIKSFLICVIAKWWGGAFGIPFEWIVLFVMTAILLHIDHRLAEK